MGKSNQNHWRLCRDCVKVEIKPPRHTYGKKLLNTRRRFIGNLCNHGNRERREPKSSRLSSVLPRLTPITLLVKNFGRFFISEKKSNRLNFLSVRNTTVHVSSFHRILDKHWKNYWIMESLCQVTWERTWSIQVHLFTLAVVLSRFIQSNYWYINWRRTKGQE